MNNFKVLSTHTSKNLSDNNNLSANFNKEITNSDSKMRDSPSKLYYNNKSLRIYIERTFRNGYQMSTWRSNN